ncbi:Ig-like domain-containing protein [Knoellia sp. 3-2P3]|uniref:Ig-like domain-containing protein n=1 Tax=unclassified Knoellia TaxID=2618719 RepID=UPI0023DA3987|nr:Ig-like domain-containing protein [Knoellia sp. 3-2P3]MDF2091244.1 Ig-like domain-containing protein [Knoellia sp. 3-2P3]
MRARSLWGRVVAGAVLVAPLTGVALSAPAQALAETETYFSYASQAGDYIGQGGSGTLTGPTAFGISGTAGSVSFSADTGSQWWGVTLAAPRGQQLRTGVYQNAARAPFNDLQPGLSVSSTGRGCNTVTGSFTIYAISADTAGRITSLDAEFTQHCEGDSAALTGVVKYAAPYVVPIVLTSSNPSTVANQPVTLTARVSPGTGPVTFLDGDQVIGQASPDAASLARFTTDRLAPGAHWLYAKQGTAISARLSQTVSSGDTSLWFKSQNGDHIGQGATASYVPPTASITARGDAEYASISVDDPATGDWWTADFAAAPGETLQPGTYNNAVRAPFRGTGQPGLSVSGSGRGCNTLLGEFTVHSIGTAPDGTIASLDVSFIQHCESHPEALTGRARFRAGPASSAVASTTSLAATTTSGGQVTLSATVTGGAGTATGQVVFTQGTKSLGTVSLDSSGRAVLVATLPIGTHPVAADYSGSPAYLTSRATSSVTVEGYATTTTLSVPKTVVKAGKPLSVSVAVSSTGTSVPTGLARLYDGVEPVGTAATLSNGNATIVWTPVAKGQRSLTVRYAGDSQHAGSQSAAVVVRVN